VCLHAVGHTSADFDAFAQRFRGGCEIIRIDWPGHGHSGPDAQPASARRYGELLCELLPRLGVREPILIGNSIGGAAALLYAAQQPVKALVLCDSGGLVPIDSLVRAFCALFAAIFARGAAGARWFPWLFALYYRRLVLPSAAAHAQRERIIASAAQVAPVLRDAWRSFGQPEADLRALLSSLRVPIWFAWARQDRVIPFARARAAIATVPQAQVQLFDAGHAAFLEQPDEFARGFAGFVRERLGLVLSAAPPAQDLPLVSLPVAQPAGQRELLRAAESA
jgi:4,5:9,10-diseco-3-hydroxy-5,9,17-trioxoandrosta-1(10),2-diene-4-oate hydrolase